MAGAGRAVLNASQIALIDDELRLCIGKRCAPVSSWLRQAQAPNAGATGELLFRETRQGLKGNCSGIPQGKCKASAATWLKTNSKYTFAEVFQPSALVRRISELSRPADLHFQDPFKDLKDAERLNLSNVANLSSVPPKALIKRGWMPSLGPSNGLRAAEFRRFGRLTAPYYNLFIPCSSARGEDAAVLRSFFTDRDTGLPLSPLGVPSYLELGAFDGTVESTTLVLDRCLGWAGVLVEAHPRAFETLRHMRTASLNLRAATCTDFRVAQFHREPFRMVEPNEVVAQAFAVPCAPLGFYLNRLGIPRIDFFSLDCEGCELTTLMSLEPELGMSLSMGVLVVEVRGDGLRAPIFDFMLRHGFAYAGMLEARATTHNYVMDDVWVNLTFLQRWWPRSRYLAGP
mmetsp:Transcript_55802/g.146485  ORF Transcript_55802/g.146485 Transcript_55802/m.146485 type:complete len:401 (-) Transcript_55802:110-1312(-)